MPLTWRLGCARCLRWHQRTLCSGSWFHVSLSEVVFHKTYIESWVNWCCGSGAATTASRLGQPDLAIATMNDFVKVCRHFIDGVSEVEIHCCSGGTYSLWYKAHYSGHRRCWYWVCLFINNLDINLLIVYKGLGGLLTLLALCVNTPGPVSLRCTLKTRFRLNDVGTLWASKLFHGKSSWLVFVLLW